MRCHAYRARIAEDHALTAGRWPEVVRNLSRAPEADLRAMAAYVASLDTRPMKRGRKSRSLRKAKGEARRRGKAVYGRACGDSMTRGRRGGRRRAALESPSGSPFRRRSNLGAHRPRGHRAADGEAAPWMPSYAGALTEDQLADLP